MKDDIKLMGHAPLTYKDNKEISKILGSNIKKARLNKGLTQKDLAQKMGVSVITIQQWEKGAYTPKTDKMLKLAKIVGYFGIDLYEGVEDFIPNEISKQSLKDINENNKLFDILTSNFNSVNEEGQQKIVDYSSDIADNPKYKKDK
jgi:transcriptional regulator with XRE-family HTH domain